MKRSAELQKRIEIVIREYSGILPYAEAFYLQSIIYAAERAEAAFGELDISLREHEPHAYSFALLQEALTHSAAVSKFFWPQRADDELASTRAGKLRLAFGLSDASPLANRKLRNSLEHFDERLDSFMLEGHFGILQPWPVVGHATDNRQGTLHRFKLLDPEGGICSILGEQFEYVPIRRDVQTILALALRLQVDGARLPSARASA